MEDLAQLSNELMTPVFKVKRHAKVVSRGLDDLWCSDLADMTGESAALNNGFRYFLVVSDFFSRRCWCAPLKKKDAATTWAAFNDILTGSKRKPARLWVDDGGEYWNATWKKELDARNITLYSVSNEVGSAPAEALIKTLKNRLWRIFTATNTRKWIDVLEGVVDAYNAHVHSAIGVAPNDITAANWKTFLPETEEFQPDVPKFNMLDWVRVAVKKNTFEKGFTPRWSYATYQIDSVYPGTPPMYGLHEEDGTTQPGRWYGAELLPTKIPHFKVVDTYRLLKKEDGKERMAEVHFMGLADKYALTVPESQLASMGV